MWSVLKWLATRLAVVRWLFKSVGGLAVLVPLALVLKAIGLPVLIVLGVLAFPVLLVLFIFGLPIFLVLLVGGAVLAFLATVLTLGLFALKIAVLVVLPLVLVWKLCAWMFRRSKHGCDEVEGGGVDPA
jgi:hypothetical protein